jgi:Zn-dependent protease with chaperone function
LVVAPLFFQFTRLDHNQPVLTSRIEAMLGRAGLEIPASCIFEMDASTKTRAINAYVTGIGASKRVVIYDNTMQKLDGDATLLVLGHETGHYVLGHILKGFVLFEAGAFAALFLGFIAFRRIVRSLGSRTGIEGEGDVASLPIMLLIITVLGFLASPISCGFSRYFEHQADQFGLEVTYGVVADPNVAAVRSFQILGEEDLEDPDPSPLIKLWLYTHPPLDERIRFAASYKPWSEGKPMEFVRSR